MADDTKTLDVKADSQEAIELARHDWNFFAALVNPDEFRYLFPSFYLTLFGLLTAFKSRVEKFAIGIPRGFAKTTFVKLLCVWYILFTNKRFILIVGASEKLALNTVADICDMLSSFNIRVLFGDWRLRVEEDTKEQKVFFFRGRDIILKGVGAGTSVRGINRKSSRPDVILMDDVQTRESAENKDITDDLFRWILGTLMMTKSNDGCTYIYVGNMYPENCILDKLRQDPSWVSFVVGGILADGTSLWEELKPIQELLAEYQSLSDLGHPEIFISEVLNSTEGVGRSGLDLAAIPQMPYYFEDTEPEGSFILIDPSSGKKQGDDCTIEHYSVVDGVAIMDELLHGTFSPLETIKAALALGLKRQTRLVCVEDVAYQSTLLFWFNHVANEEGISGFEFHPVSPKNQAKNNRIKRGLIRCIEGKTLLHPSVRSKVLDQANSWDPLKINNRDDIIDPLGYVEEVMQKYPEFIIKQIFDVDVDFGSAAHTESLSLPF